MTVGASRVTCCWGGSLAGEQEARTQTCSSSPGGYGEGVITSLQHPMGPASSSKILRSPSSISPSAEALAAEPTPSSSAAGHSGPPAGDSPCPLTDRLPSCVLSRLLLRIPPWSRKQLRLTCRTMRDLVDQQVYRLVVDRWGVWPSRFPALEHLEVLLWKPLLTESDILPTILSLPLLLQLRSIKIKAPPAVGARSSGGRSTEGWHNQVVADQRGNGVLAQLAASATAAARRLVRGPARVAAAMLLQPEQGHSSSTRNSAMAGTLSLGALKALLEAIPDCRDAPELDSGGTSCMRPSECVQVHLLTEVPLMHLQALTTLPCLGTARALEPARPSVPSTTQLPLQKLDTELPRLEASGPKVGLQKASLIEQEQQLHGEQRLQQQQQQEQDRILPISTPLLDSAGSSLGGPSRVPRVQLLLNCSLLVACPGAFIAVGKLAFLADIRLDIPMSVASRPGMIGHLSGCLSLRKLDMVFSTADMRYAIQEHGQLPDGDVQLQGLPHNAADPHAVHGQPPLHGQPLLPLHVGINPDPVDVDAGRADGIDWATAAAAGQLRLPGSSAIVAVICEASGLARLVGLPHLETMTLRGDVALAPSGFRILACLRQMVVLTLWLKTFVCDEDLLPFSGGAGCLRTLQLSRLQLKTDSSFSTKCLPQLKQLTSLNYYISEKCQRNFSSSFPSVTSAICRDWPLVTDPSYLQGLPRLSTLVLMQHSSCNSAFDIYSHVRVRSHVSALLGLTQLQALTFKAFSQAHHLGPLLGAISKLPCLRSLTVIAAPNAKAATVARFEGSFASDNSSLGSTTAPLQIETLVLDAQGSAWQASKLLIRAVLPRLRVLRIQNQKQPLSLKFLKQTIEEGMPRLELMELTACHGPGLGPKVMSDGLFEKEGRSRGGPKVLWDGEEGLLVGDQDNTGASGCSLTRRLLCLGGS